MSETGVTRVILTAAQANNLLVGSCVNVGDASRAAGNPLPYVIIESIEDVTIEGTAYKAVNLDTETTITTTVGTTHIATMPYYSGWNDGVKGNDGARFTPAGTKEPGLLQKVEFMNGSYMIIADEFMQWSSDDDNYYLDLYTCHDQAKVSPSTITADYVKATSAGNGTLSFPKADGTAGRWLYIQDYRLLSDRQVCWPKAVGGTASSSNGAKAALFVSPAASGVRAAWSFGSLNYGGTAGVPCRNSSTGVSTAYWNGSGGSPDLAG